MLTKELNRDIKNRFKAKAPKKRDEEKEWVNYTYYYYPDLELYLQVETGIWFYFDNSTWRATRILPEKQKRAYRVTTYKVILHFTGSNPTLHHHINKVKYPCRPKCQSEKKESMLKVKHSKNKFRCFYIPLDENEDIEELIF